MGYGLLAIGYWLLAVGRDAAEGGLSEARVSEQYQYW